MECEEDRAILARTLTITLSIIEQRLAVFRVQWYETQSVGNVFISENGRVCFDLHKLYRNGWNFSKDCAAEGVGKGEINATKIKFDTISGNLCVKPS